jgi:hypothetical protein
MNTNNFTNILKNSKSFLGMPIGTRRSCSMKKTADEKSRDTVLLSEINWLCLVKLTLWRFSSLRRWLTGFSSIPEYDNLLLPLPLKMDLRRYVEENWLSGVSRLRKVHVRVTDGCWKERRSVTLSRRSQLISLKPLWWWWCPIKIQYEKTAGPPV